MKRKTKVLLSSVATIAMSASLAVGGTYALFTSEDEVNIAVSSGTVNVTATVDNTDTTNDNIAFGAVDFSAKSMSIERMVPGDSVSFDIVVENESNVAVKYRTLLEVVAEDGKNPLTMTITSKTDATNSVTFTDFAYTDWTTLTSAGVVDTFEVTVAFPETGKPQNEFQDKEWKITYSVEAVQANADYTNTSYGLEQDENGVYYVNNATDLKIFASNVNTGLYTYEKETVKLAADIDLEGAYWTPIGNVPDTTKSFHGTFDGSKSSAGTSTIALTATDTENYTISNFKVDAGVNAAGLFGYVEYRRINEDYTATVKNVTVADATINGNHFGGGIAGYIYGDILNCKVVNSSITLTPNWDETTQAYDNGDKAGGIVGWASLTVLDGNSVDNVSVKAYRDFGGIVGHVGDISNDGTLNTVANNSVSNVTLTYDDSGNTYANEQKNAGAIYGRTASSLSSGSVNNTISTVITPNGWAVEDETKETVKPEDKPNTTITITTRDELAAFALLVNEGNTYNGWTVLLGADIDLENYEWTPIGNSTNKFQGTFDGQNYTVSNLKITGRKNYVGLFGYTTIGEVKNLNINNASVSGRVGVGALAGSPYTAKYSNIALTGKVEIMGMSYVGGLLGRNCYANVTDITIDVEEGSYVKADSVENGVAYRTYVGGVIGFMGEGSQTLKNVTSNIDVYGSTCDVGGIVGIAHYGNTFINCSSSGNVTITDATEEADALEIGGIAGVWHDGGSNVTFTGCEYTGTLNSNIAVEYENNGLVGKAYSATGNGKLIINGRVTSVDDLANSLNNGGSVVLGGDVETQENMVMNGGYLNGNGNTIDAYDVRTNSDCAITTTGGMVENVTITGDNWATRAIGAGSSGTYTLTEDLYINNVTIDKVMYAINGSGNVNDGTESVTVTNSTVYGWISFSNIASFNFENCTIGKGNSYDGYMVVYGTTTFTNCTFEEFDMCASDAVAAGSVITFTNCTNDGVKVTVENFKELFMSLGDDEDFNKLQACKIVIDGEEVVW